MKAFGVGCFHFSLNEKLKSNITINDYVLEVEKVLASINSISEINTDYEESTGNDEVDVSVRYPLLIDGGRAYPHVLFYALTFKIYVPYRIQANLCECDEGSLSTGTENFKITMLHRWHGPVAFVESLNAGDENDPSTGVQIAREFLTQAFQPLDTFLTFDYIGPSPFHADFYLLKHESAIDSEDQQFIFEHKKKPGYDTLNFQYAPDSFESEESALKFLLRAIISEELAFYYLAQAIECERINSWEEITNSLQLILEFENNSSKKTWKQKLIERPKILRSLFREIIQFKGSEIFHKSEIDRSFSSRYNSGKYQVYFKHFIENAIHDSQQFPISETKELLSYIDQKNSKSLELLVVFFAAVLGGMIGAVVTVLFGK